MPVLLHSGDVDEATAAVSAVFHPHELTRVGTVSRFEADLQAVATNSMVTGQVRYNSNSDLFCPSIDGYHVNIPLTGGLVSVAQGERTIVEEGNAVVYQTGSDARILTPPNSQLNMFGMKLARSAVHTTIENLLDRPVADPITMHGKLDLTGADGQAWRALVLHTYQSQLAGTMMANPMLAEPLTHAIVTGLLSLTEHQYSEELERPAALTAPVTIRHALEYINSTAALPLSPTSIAREVGLSVRALHRGFQEFVHTTPMEYVRNVRMRRVHEELVRTDPDTDTVAAVAGRWGFYHYGRFSQDYRRQYGVSPSKTLRHG
ncbi:AraC family transcriptional regulator [Rhodococcus sp. T2V]|uniref:AraC family transcriptional regulator n=1 Tax=Rhodococcus sp. T2V TaxID=3034164 RepID=UPI0023E17A33|nr:AraC family transcriptional regulator [Rhodococcus sp. T2V]MDF3307550.1 AraC family transcriptional regulator [Rhodococcus sp. T2V]